MGLLFPQVSYGSAGLLWPVLSPPAAPDPLAGVQIGDPFKDGYFAGIIDTTTGNIDPADASQSGLRYALIISPKSLEATKQFKTTADAVPTAALTRWDGLAATVAMASASYPGASYCNGLAYSADGASQWYMPAMDEFEVLYRNLKPTTEANATGSRSGNTFPSETHAVGYNPSSDPAGAAYVAGDPVQTAVALFQDGGGQDFGDAGTNRYHWTATERSTSEAWAQSGSGGGAGYQFYYQKSSSYPVRPVRRLVL